MYLCGRWVTRRLLFSSRYVSINKLFWCGLVCLPGEEWLHDGDRGSGGTRCSSQTGLFRNQVGSSASTAALQATGAVVVFFAPWRQSFAPIGLHHCECHEPKCVQMSLLYIHHCTWQGFRVVVLPSSNVSMPAVIGTDLVLARWPRSRSVFCCFRFQEVLQRDERKRPGQEIQLWTTWVSIFCLSPASSTQMGVFLNSADISGFISGFLLQFLEICHVENN